MSSQVSVDGVGLDSVQDSISESEKIGLGGDISVSTWVSKMGTGLGFWGSHDKIQSRFTSISKMFQASSSVIVLFARLKFVESYEEALGKT